jgi:hypothetical protein
MSLSIFDGMGRENVSWPSDAEQQGLLAIEVLDAVQTIADVLVDDKEYRVRFAPDGTAHTDFEGRQIVVTAKPLTQGGRPFADIVDIITGFAVHEIGHARADDDLSRRVYEEWPGKVTPGRLANILQDVRLEQAIVDRFPGLAGVFDPAFEWVVGQDPAAYAKVMTWPDGIAERLNFVGCVVRYRPWTDFANDPITQDEVLWWEDWGAVTGSATDDELFQLVRDGIARLREGATIAPKLPPGPEPEGPGPDDTTCPPPVDLPPTNQGQGDPDQDFTDPDDTEGEGKGEDKPDGESDDPDGEGKGQSTDGEARDTGADMDKGETLDREDSDETMGKGGGGDGKAITKAQDGDDPDAGLEPDKVAKSVDEINGEGRDYTAQYRAESERGAERIKAGAFGSMKVRVRL